MPIETAVRSFHQPHNCAEAVFYAFDQAGKNTQGIDLKRSGGGRAPDGLCGALFGGKLIISSDKHEALERQFVQELGSSKCRELKRVLKVPCAKCVETSARLTDALR